MSKNRKWNFKNIPDQKGRVAIVTGANSGIGYETAKALALKNALVVVASRNADKGKAAVKAIQAEGPGIKPVFMQLDLSDLKSVEAFSKIFKSKFNRLDLLINNAGVMMPPYSKTGDGFELQFGTNHLGHFALTGHLLDLIKKTPDSRIVNVSSMAHKWGDLNFDDLNWEKRNYQKSVAYGDSKIANLLFTYELQRKLKTSGAKVKVSAAHPGWTATNLQKHSGLFRSLNPLFAMKPPQGALPTLYAATAPEVTGGDYFGPGGMYEMRGYPKKVTSNENSHDTETASKLWDISAKLTHVAYLI